MSQRKFQAGIRTGRMEPVWEPLLRHAPEEVADYMWMFEVEGEDGTKAQAYKHRWTRRYLYIEGGS
jgi:hypothetical protein